MANRPWKILNDDARAKEQEALNAALDDKLDALHEAQKERSRRADVPSPGEDQMGRMEMFIAEEPRRSLDDLVVTAVTLQQIKDMLAKVRHQHTLYEVWNLRRIDPYGARTAINLYGPPGTGKSFTAEAIAHYLGKRIIRVNYAEIESKYVGDTPKNIKAAFAKAKAEDAVIFFDEADSILGRRMTNVTQSADHGVNVSRSVMLLELDRFEGITLFATNLASNYDAAFVRRILGHIEMPLPDHDCRVRLWRLHIPPEMPYSLRDPEDFIALADASEGVSGGDILNAVVIGATSAVQRHGSHQRVTLDDLMRAIAQVRKAKQDVGNAPGVRFTNQTVPIDKAPPEVQKALENSPDA